MNSAFLEQTQPPVIAPNPETVPALAVTVTPTPTAAATPTAPPAKKRFRFGCHGLIPFLPNAFIYVVYVDDATGYNLINLVAQIQGLSSLLGGEAGNFAGGLVAEWSV